MPLYVFEQELTHFLIKLKQWKIYIYFTTCKCSLFLHLSPWWCTPCSSMRLRPQVPHRWHNDPGKSHNYTRHRYVLTCKVWHRNRRSHIYHHLQREECLSEMKYLKGFICAYKYTLSLFKKFLIDTKCVTD